MKFVDEKDERTKKKVRKAKKKKYNSPLTFSMYRLQTLACIFIGPEEKTPLHVLHAKKGRRKEGRKRRNKRHA